MYDKRDNFDFDIINFPCFLYGDVPNIPSYGVYISQIRFARESIHLADFSVRNKTLTAKLLQQGFQYHKLWKGFSKFYRRHKKIVSKYDTRLNSSTGTLILWWFVVEV